jgi:hypothetical protein
MWVGPEMREIDPCGVERVGCDPPDRTLRGAGQRSGTGLWAVAAMPGDTAREDSCAGVFGCRTSKLHDEGD